ncbi:MAG TPA: hypothetical protein VGC41_01075 [Kofleriaceae bacterium]
MLKPGDSWIDPAVLLSSCESDPQLLDTIVSVLAVHLPRQLAALRDQIFAADAVAAQNSAHQLQAMIGTASSRAGSIVAELERAAAAGKLDDARQLLEQLTRATDALLLELPTLSIFSLQQRVS